MNTGAALAKATGPVPDSQYAYAIRFTMAFNDGSTPVAGSRVVTGPDEATARHRFWESGVYMSGYGPGSCGAIAGVTIEEVVLAGSEGDTAAQPRTSQTPRRRRRRSQPVAVEAVNEDAPTSKPKRSRARKSKA